MSQTRRQLLALLSKIGETSHSALQQQLAVDGATITRLVKQFESAGVLSRQLDPQDNRYTLVSLTVSGHKIAAGLSAAHRQFQARLLVGITREEQEIMIRVLEQLRANVRSVSQRCARNKHERTFERPGRSSLKGASHDSSRYQSFRIPCL